MNRMLNSMLEELAAAHSHVRFAAWPRIERLAYDVSMSVGKTDDDVRPTELLELISKVTP